jgi:hypothetical protein
MAGQVPADPSMAAELATDEAAAAGAAPETERSSSSSAATAAAGSGSAAVSPGTDLRIALEAAAA